MTVVNESDLIVDMRFVLYSKSYKDSVFISKLKRYGTKIEDTLYQMNKNVTWFVINSFFIEDINKFNYSGFNFLNPIHWIQSTLDYKNLQNIEFFISNDKPPVEDNVERLQVISSRLSLFDIFYTEKNLVNEFMDYCGFISKNEFHLSRYTWIDSETLLQILTENYQDESDLFFDFKNRLIELFKALETLYYYKHEVLFIVKE